MINNIIVSPFSILDMGLFFFNYQLLYRVWGGPNLQPKESLVTAPIVDSLKRIQIPSLIFKGDREPCTTEVDWGKQYAEILPNAELYTIQGACHDPWLANPSEFLEIGVEREEKWRVLRVIEKK